MTTASLPGKHSTAPTHQQSRSIDIAELPANSLAQLLAIRKKKEHHIQEIAKLDALSVAILAGHGEAGPAIALAIAAATRKRSVRGTVKNTIVDTLRSAGAAGMTVKDLSEKTGFDRRKLERWLFSNSPKHVRGFEKIGPALYRVFEGKTAPKAAAGKRRRRKP
jgi:hypothetical protein